MDIRSWVNGHPKGQRNRAIRQIADAAGVTPGAVRHWIAGLRSPRPEHLAAVESVTGIPASELWAQVLKEKQAA